MDRNCEMCKNRLPYGCTKWECQFEPKLSERDLHFRYLDGCADGLNEARKDTIKELEKLKEEITEYRMKIHAGNDEFHVGRLFGCDEVVEIINNHISELKGETE